MVEHDENREAELQRLLSAILEDGRAEFRDDDYGPYRYSCPFCYKEVNESAFTRGLDAMRFITHDVDCAYLIARDLRIKE
jgi:hypothetical protein